MGSSRDDLIEELNLQEQGEQMVLQVKELTKEAGRSVNSATARRWLIRDREQKNTEGQALAYEIRLPQSEHQDIGPDSETFTREDIYFTALHDCELYASHNPSLEGCADSLSGFVNQETLQGADLVVWPSTTFYHMPRAEDAPFMDAHWSYISLTPRDWQARNPLSNSPDLSGTDLARPEPPITPPTPGPGGPNPPTPPITPPSSIPMQSGGTGSLDYGLLLLLVLARWGFRGWRNRLD